MAWFTGVKMAENIDPIGVANSSGFPFQIAVQRMIASDVIHWFRIRAAEHSWVSRDGATSGYIDLVIQSADGSLVLLIECKRLQNTSWVFMGERGDSPAIVRGRHFVSRPKDNEYARSKRFGWIDVDMMPGCPEFHYCAVRGGGDEKGARSGLIERAASELVLATSALAREDQLLGSVQPGSFRVYVPVIVTNVDLHCVEFDPGQISLENGKLPAGASAKVVPFLRLRKQLSTDVLAGQEVVETDSMRLAKAKEQTVFIVTASRLMEFLRIHGILSGSSTDLREMP